MTDTKVAPTVHGDVEYETVTCASCEREVAKDNAKRFYIGNEIQYKDWSTLERIEVEFDRSTVRRGWACEYCAENGPVQYPQKKQYLKDALKWPFTGPIFFVLMKMALVAMILIFIIGVVPA